MKTPRIAFSIFVFFLSCQIFSSLQARNPVSKFQPYERFLGKNLSEPGKGWPFQTKSVWLHAGTSFGLIGYPSFGSRTAFLPILLSADYSYSSHFAVGPYLGFYNISYSDSYAGTNHQSSLSSYKIGARWLIHGTDLLNELLDTEIDEQKFDLYSGISAGLEIRSWSFEQSGYRENRSDFEGTVFPHLGLLLGFKYLIKDRLGVFAEAGRGTFGAFQFGASFKLN